MSKFLTTVSMILFLALPVIACTQGALTPEGRAINYASKYLVKTFGNVEQSFYQQPTTLRARVNPCRCSDELKYDVHLNGQWRRVAIKGQDSALSDFELKAKEAGDNTFEADFLLLQLPFRTPQNQDIYWLEVFSTKLPN